MTRGVFTETIPTQIELQLIVAAWFLDQCGYDLASPILVELVGEILRPKSRRTALGAMNTSQPKFSIPVDAVEPAAFRQFVSPFVALVHCSAGRASAARISVTGEMSSAASMAMPVTLERNRSVRVLMVKTRCCCYLVVRWITRPITR